MFESRIGVCFPCPLDGGSNLDYCDNQWNRNRPIRVDRPRCAGHGNPRNYNGSDHAAEQRQRGICYSRLPVGSYTVTVSKQGFSTFTEKGIMLHPATTATVAVEMKTGAVNAQVTVTATAAEVETRTPEVSL